MHTICAACSLGFSFFICQSEGPPPANKLLLPLRASKPPECVYQCLFASVFLSLRGLCVMRAKVGHQVAPLFLNNSSSLPAAALKDSPLWLNPSQNGTTTKWRRSAKSPNTCSLRPCLTGQSLSVLQTVEWARVWGVISSRLLQRCLSINIMNIAPGLLVRVAGIQHCWLW